MPPVSLASRGQSFAQIVKVFCMAKGHVSDAAIFAEHYSREVREAFTKTAEPGTIGDSSGQWGAQLVDVGGAGVKFIAAVQERSILGRLAGARRVRWRRESFPSPTARKLSLGR